MKQIARAATQANTSHVPLATTPPATTARHAVRHATRRAARRPRSRPRAGDVAEDLASAHRVPSCVKQCMAKSSAVHPMCRPRHPRRPRLSCLCAYACAAADAMCSCATVGAWLPRELHHARRSPCLAPPPQCRPRAPAVAGIARAEQLAGTHRSAATPTPPQCADAWRRIL